MGRLNFSFLILAVCFLTIFSLPAMATIIVGIELSNSVVAQSEQVQAKFVISNDGAATAENVTFLLDYPAGLFDLDEDLISTGGNANTVDCPNVDCDPGEVVVWSLGNIPAGDSVAVFMLPVVGSNTPDGTVIDFDTELRVDGVQEVLASRSVVVESDPFFDLSIIESLSPATNGDTLEYIINFGNISTTSSNTQLRFPIPPGSALVSATGNGSESGGIVTWNLGTLDSGNNGQQRVVVDVTATAGELLKVDSASISGTDSSFVNQIVRHSMVTPVENGNRALLDISLNPEPVRPSEQVRTEVTVSNPSSNTLFGVSLLVRYPVGLFDLDEDLISTGGNANTVDCPNVDCDAGEVVVWSLGNIPAGDSVTVFMLPVVGSNISDGTIIEFDSELRVDGVQEVFASRSVVVESDPFFDLSIIESLSPVANGETLEYIINFGNIGTTSSNTQLQFPIPSGSAFVSATGNGSESGGIVTWDLGTLGSGNGGQQRVVVDVTANAGELLKVDSASISGTDSSFINHLVRHSMVTPVENLVKPRAVITIDPTNSNAGSQVDIELLVTNTTSDFIFDVSLLLRYPVGLFDLDEDLISTGGNANTVDCPNIDCDPGEVVVWNLGTFPPGQSINLSLSPFVSSNLVQGSIIEFDGELRVDGIQQSFIGASLFSGGTFTAGTSEDDQADDELCFPVLTENSGAAVICL